MPDCVSTLFTWGRREIRLTSGPSYGVKGSVGLRMPVAPMRSDGLVLFQNTLKEESVLLAPAIDPSDSPPTRPMSNARLR